jgi:predicted acylesterase/phospholipase RssA
MNVLPAARAPERAETLVVSGGGMKGVASLGAAVALKRAGALRGVNTYVGTSAGALVATALALDRASDKLLDGFAASRYRPDIDLGNLARGFGLDGGSGLQRWIDYLLDGGRYTFADVLRLHGVRLVVCVTNVTERRAEYLGPDTAPDMDVALALRMSCAVPLYFSAVSHGGCLYVDGGVSDNFPLAWAGREFGRGGVLGIAFRPRPVDGCSSLESYVGALLECATRHHHGDCHGDDHNVLRLDTGARSAFDFGMPRRDLRRLYGSGARQARAWLKKTA